MAGSTLTSVRPEKILKELEELWVELGKADDGQRAAVLRACAMTLIVAVERDGEGGDAEDAVRTLAELMHEHPSRAIVLIADSRAVDTLEARVLAQCWMPFGRRQQICCEEIEITSSMSRLGETPQIVTGVTVADLPVVLWCRGGRLAANLEFQRLFPLLDKLIVDSSTMGDPAAALEFVQGLSAARTVADLAWTRLTPWREMISMLFDGERNQAVLPAIASVRIEHRGDAPPVEARYLAKWFENAAPSVRPEFAASDGATEAIAGVAIEAPGWQASIRHGGDSCVETRINELVHRTAFPPQSDYDLLREELSILGPDPVFLKCLR